MRVLKPTGSFVLNINEGCEDGERQHFIMDLVQALRAQGWRYVETYHWHKKTAYPGKWSKSLPATRTSPAFISRRHDISTWIKTR